MIFHLFPSFPSQILCFEKYVDFLSVSMFFCVRCYEVRNVVFISSISNIMI